MIFKEVGGMRRWGLLILLLSVMMLAGCAKHIPLISDVDRWIQENMW